MLRLEWREQVVQLPFYVLPLFIVLSKDGKQCQMTKIATLLGTKPQLYTI